MAHSTEAVAVLQKFVARINAHDPAGIVASCTADHVCIDSLRSRLSGRERLNKLRLAILPFSRTTASRSSLPLRKTFLPSPAVSRPPFTQHRRNDGAYLLHGVRS